jgi:hypothetical protein
MPEPSWHVPEQHEAAPLQKLALSMQAAQVPEVLVRDNPLQFPEQHSLWKVQAFPLLVQAAWHLPPVQDNPEQQAASLVQVSPAMRQPQVPPQTSEQQSAFDVQGALKPPQAAAWHLPPEQFPEQQSTLLVQAMPTEEQMQWLPMQNNEQQSVSDVQGELKPAQAAAWHLPPVQLWFGPQQTPPSQHACVVGQQVVPPGQRAWPLGHWQAPFTQLVPPVQTLPQPAQFSLVPSGMQVPLQQPRPWVQQVTWSECCEAQTFCVLPPHCLQALLQLARCGRGRVLQ